MHMEAEGEIDLETQEMLLAASEHNVNRLKVLLRTVSANCQDPETGFTPLHAAVAALESENLPSESSESAKNTIQVQDEKIDTEANAAAETVRLLLQNGAIWNDLDANNETAGCIALRLGLRNVYDLIVDAGTRAELLLNRLDEYEALTSDFEDDLDNGDEKNTENMHTDLVVLSTDASPSHNEAEAAYRSAFFMTNEDYLKGKLTYRDNQLLDHDKDGVMMNWEAGIMQRTADALLPRAGLTCLNIGHGLGIVDDNLQKKLPAAHHIIEAHPDVLRKMQQDGWYEKSNVTVHEGRWQDILPKLSKEGITFDAIYYDTFAEDYKVFKYFFSEFVTVLLGSSGTWSFFHGLGADRRVCYDVYTKISEMDLFEAGFDVEWESIALPETKASGVWDGVRRKYWTLDEYRLPICTFVQ